MTNAQLLYTKDSPFVTKLLVNQKLNKQGSAKDTRHFEISLKGSGINYLPGDSLYVQPENDPNMVDSLLAKLILDLDQDAERKRFIQEINITRPSNKFFKLIEQKTNSKYLANELAERFLGYSTLAVIGAISEIKFSSNEIVDNSSKLQARAYSIASSIRKHPEEVHLCIARVDQELNGQKVLGVCSNYLSERLPLNSLKLKIYLHSNDKFRLPADKSKNIIMVGPGTGIAPFRAFIEERNVDRDSGHKLGQDWLFFGDQKQEFDYLYGDELENYQKQYGLKISTAFSRDQAEKIYVQNRMLENSKEIFDWLENGAHFYVCGDARKMAKDVDQALHQIVEAQGKDPKAYIANLKDSNRYSRDVY